MDRGDPQSTAPQPPAGRPRKGPRGAAAAAVLGSVAALGSASPAVARPTVHANPDTQRRPARRAEALPPGERAVLGAVFGALSAKAPGIARPILDLGVGDGTITAAQAERFLGRLAAAGTPEPSGAPSAGALEGPPPSPAGHALFQRVLAAIQAELPVVAVPLLAAALAAGTITEPQAARLRARLSQGPRLGFGLVIGNARAVGATRLP